MAPSRLTDDFKLELRFVAPDQREEDAIRDFVAWLSQVEIKDAPGAATLEEFEQAIRNAAHLIGSPLSSPFDFMYDSPPMSLHLHPADAPEYLRAAFRIWTTELRGLWKAAGCTGIPDEECVMLAQLEVPVLHLPGGWQVDGVRPVGVHEERRPYLIHLRLLQEWLLGGRRESAPSDDVTHEMAFGQSASAGISRSYSRADHTHGTPPAPTITGAFVEHPSAAGTYAIVAAGTVRGDNNNRQPVYNVLRVTGIGTRNGQVSITFSGYEEPLRTGGKFQYIVKALPVFNDAVKTNVVVNFHHFDPNPNVGFVLSVMDMSGNLLGRNVLAGLEIMIEVSRFPST